LMDELPTEREMTRVYGTGVGENERDSQKRT
jgi:hypothetical protein